MKIQKLLGIFGIIASCGLLSTAATIHDRAFDPPKPGRPHKLKKKAKMQKASRKRNRK